MITATPNQTKADAIRTYMNEHPDASPTAAAEALTKMGVKDVTPQYVSTIKSMDKRKSSGGTKTDRSPISVEEIFAAAEFIQDMGGYARARQALDVVAKLQA